MYMHTYCEGNEGRVSATRADCAARPRLVFVWLALGLQQSAMVMMEVPMDRMRCSEAELEAAA